MQKQTDGLLFSFSLLLLPFIVPCTSHSFNLFFCYPASIPPSGRIREVPDMALDSNFTFFHDYGPLPGTMDMSRLEAERAVVLNTSECNYSRSGTSEEKKKLATDQMELLEWSFQQEMKLEPERKLRLAQELGLPPRQVTVWFQNRRARWKTKRLEQLYTTLKQEFDAISKEKQKLEEEVVTLKAQLEKKIRKQGSSEVGEEDEPAESSRSTTHTLNRFQTSSYNSQLVDCNSLLTIKNYWDVFSTSPYPRHHILH